jgi:pyroglutamyl-peptidase
MKLLLTAFEPFGGAKINQSKEILEATKNTNIERLLLPVEFEEAYIKLKAYVEDRAITHIIALGEGPNPILHLEHLALNIQHARIADNLGYQPQQQTVVLSGPLSLKTSFPIDNISQLLLDKKIPFVHSYHAGTYVCNDLYFRMLLQLPNISSLFIHVPNQNENFSLNLIGVETILDWILKPTS